jgi:hypothetical protein
MRAMVRVRRRSRSSPAAARLSLARATTQRRPFFRSTRARKPETVTRLVPGGGGDGGGGEGGGGGGGGGGPGGGGPGGGGPGGGGGGADPTTICATMNSWPGTAQWYG